MQQGKCSLDTIFPYDSISIKGNKWWGVYKWKRDLGFSSGSLNLGEGVQSQQNLEFEYGFSAQERKWYVFEFRSIVAPQDGRNRN